MTTFLALLSRDNQVPSTVGTLTFALGAFVIRVVRFDILGMNHCVSEKGSASLSSHRIWMKMYICLYIASAKKRWANGHYATLS